MEEQAKAIQSSCFLLFLLLQVSTASFWSIKYLPGFQGPLPFELETGYLGVEPDDSQLFYYFIKSQQNPKDDPLILWLTGGPGCSAFSGLVFEIGPLKFEVVEYNGSLPTLVLNPHSWTQLSNIIFLDAPIGTGFSYAKTQLGSLSGDFIQVNQVVQFLRQWLKDHPEFGSNRVYIAGDSYSGITVPAIAQIISQENEQGKKPLINLKGCILGNPGTDGNAEANSKIPYVHGKGFISHQLFQSLKRSCGGEYTYIDPTNEECLKYMQDYYKCVTGLNVVQVLEPLCYFFTAKVRPIGIFGATFLHNHFQLQQSLHSNLSLSAVLCRDYAYTLSEYWANDKKVQEALHVQQGSIEKWVRCNYGISYQVNILSSVEYHVYLANNGYRSLVYRYTRTYSNGITFATVKGGGHTAPEYKPAECLAMFKRWTREDPL